MVLLQVWLAFPLIVSLQSIEASYWQPVAIDFVGHTLKSSDVNFCDKNICISDASRMGLWMNHSQNPCDDFYNYVCGAFVYNKAPHERYAYQGFQKMLIDNISEQRRKVLAARIRKNDNKFAVIAKSLFQKCVDSRYIIRQGKSDVLKFLDSIGGFPLIDGVDWDSEGFDKAKVFENVPYSMLEYFRMGFVFDNNKTGVFISLKQTFDSTLPDQQPEVLAETLRQIAEDFGIERTPENMEDLTQVDELLRNFSSLSRNFEQYPPNFVVTIKNLNDYMNGILCGSSVLQLNWTKIFESEIPVQGDIDDDFEINIIYPHLVCDTLQFMKALDNRTFSNYFALMLLSKFRHNIAVYFHSKFENKFYGTLNAPQRFEQCTSLVRIYLPVAFTSLLIEQFASPSLIASASEVANRTVKVFIKLLKQKRKYVKIPIQKLETIKLIIGYPEEILDPINVEKHYETLNLTGDENFFELRSKSDEFNKRLQFRRFAVATRSGLLKDAVAYDWTKYTREEETDEARYDHFANLIYFPTLWLQQPYFHPDRPRYYQDATLAMFFGKPIFEAMGPFLKRRTSILKFDWVEAFFDEYKKWDDEAVVKDPSLPGFLLSNQQMFWVTLIHKNCVKLQSAFNDTNFSNGRRNAMAYFKVNKEFQRTFGCDLPHLSNDEIWDLKYLYDNFY